LLALPGVDTENIVVLTFTEKAARQMEERISALCDTGYKELRVGTFHAFAHRFLREEGRGLPIPNPFRIAPDVERWNAMVRVLERLRPSELYHLPRPRDIVLDLLKLLERAKQEMAGPDDYAEVARQLAAGRSLGALMQGQIAEVYQAYSAELMAAGLLDFDDTIYWTARLLESNSATLDRYRKRFPYIMVDEFQDTNYSQLRMVELLAGDNGNVAVVGDDDQSIYKFRGASVANLRRFRTRYPLLNIVRLSENYRSSRQVLAPAARMIAKNTERVDKQVTSERDGPAARVYGAPDMHHEVAWAVERIADLVESGTAPAGEIAVLVRTNAQLRPFARALQRAGIPYQLFGGRGFLDQPEIKDVRAMLQWIADPAESQAACRVLAMPGVTLPADLILRFAAVAHRDKTTIEDIAGKAVAAGDVGEDAAATVRGVLEMIAELRASSLRERADEVVFQALEKSRYVDVIDYPVEIQRIQAGANVHKFVELVDEFCEADKAGDGATLGHLVNWLAAIEESASEQAIATIDVGSDAVQLMTVHQAKGLEFDAVLCPGLVEDRFPYRSQPERMALPPQLIKEEAPTRDARLAEERRLAFVALTRSRTHLFLSYAERYEGGKRWKASRFLADMGFLPAPDGNVPEPTAAEPAPAVDAPPPPPAAQAALPMAHPDVQELIVSYSQLEEYRRCPRAYQYREVYRLPTRPSPERDFGVAVHAAIKQILEESPDAQKPVEEAVAVFDHIFGAAPFSDQVNADLWLERGRQFIRELHRKGRLSGKTLHVAPEQSFNLKMQGFRVRGRIDRIDRAENGYRLIDYKTGEARPEWELERDLQLGLYAIAADEVLGLSPVELVICYLEDAIEIPVLKTTSQLDADRAEAEMAAAGITAGDFTPKPSTWKCRHCDFRLVCDAAL
jgi:DNA helicase-2/ATP-dependent DNA helicase PcrA